MSVPVITVDMAFGSKPTDASYVWTNVHKDGAVERVMDLAYSRGRQNETNRIATGTGTVMLGDKASDFDPANGAGRYSANVKPYVPIRAQATIAGVTYNLFNHYVDKWPRTLRVASSWTQRGISTVDGFDWFAHSGLKGQVFASELSGARIGHVCDAVSWPVALRNIDVGNAGLLAAVTFALTDTTNALSHLMDVSDTENGLVYIGADGLLRAVQRWSLVKSPYTVSQVTFHDAVAGGAGYSFVDAVPSYDNDNTYNDWIVTASGSANPQEAQDANSQLMNGLRSKAFSSLILTDTEALAQAQWKVALLGNPLQRLDSITVRPGADTGAWQAVLALEIGQRITVREQPPGYAAPVSTDYLIQSIRVHLPKGPATQAEFVFGLWPAGLYSGWFQLDDAAYGLLDPNKAGY